MQIPLNYMLTSPGISAGPAVPRCGDARSGEAGSSMGFEDLLSGFVEMKGTEETLDNDPRMPKGAIRAVTWLLVLLEAKDRFQDDGMSQETLVDLLAGMEGKLHPGLDPDGTQEGMHSPGGEDCEGEPAAFLTTLLPGLLARLGLLEGAPSEGRRLSPFPHESEARKGHPQASTTPQSDDAGDRVQGLWDAVPADRTSTGDALPKGAASQQVLDFLVGLLEQDGKRMRRGDGPPLDTALAFRWPWAGDFGVFMNAAKDVDRLEVMGHPIPGEVVSGEHTRPPEGENSGQLPQGGDRSTGLPSGIRGNAGSPGGDPGHLTFDPWPVVGGNRMEAEVEVRPEIQTQPGVTFFGFEPRATLEGGEPPGQIVYPGEPRQIVDQMMARIEFGDPGSDGVEIQLEPEFLGRIRMELSVSGGTVRGRLSAENQHVGALLSQNLHLLEEGFRDQGYTVASLTVEKDRSGESGPRRQKQGQHPFHRIPAKIKNGPGGEPEEHADSPIATRGLNVMRAGVDYFI